MTTPTRRRTANRWWLPSVGATPADPLKVWGDMLTRQDHTKEALGALVTAAERVCELGLRKSHALSLVRVQQAAETNGSMVARVRLELTTSAL